MRTLKKLNKFGPTLAGSLALLVAACTGVIGSGDSDGDLAGGSARGTSGGETINAAGGGGACVDRPLERRVWTLSRSEYDTSVKAVLGTTSAVAGATFPAESRANGFTKNPAAEMVDSNLVSLMMTAAETIAAASVKSEVAFIQSTLKCTLAASPSPTAPDPCAVSYLQSRGGAFFRRPITQEEQDDLYATYLVGVANPFDATDATSSGVELVIATLLQMPQFFYRTELGDPGDTSSQPQLTQYEIASAISFMATGGPPDTTLLAAAKAGTLTAGPAIAAHYQRLVASPAGHSQMQEFVLEWLGEDGIAKLGGASGGVVTPAIAEGMQAEAQSFAEEAIFNGAGTVQELLTGGYTFANADLAAFYGFPTAGLTSNFTKVSLDASSMRGGLLSQGAFLISASTTGVPLLHRGVIIRNKVLCETLPSLGSLGLAGFKASPLGTPPAGTTIKQALKNTVSGVCYTCHQYFQDVGYGLENFDAWGRLQTTQNGGNVDPTGEIVESTSVDNTGLIADPMHFTHTSFADAPGLAAALAAHPRTNACFASRVVSFASGRATGLDECATGAVQASPSGGAGATVQQQFLNYVQSNAFVTRTR